MRILPSLKKERNYNLFPIKKTICSLVLSIDGRRAPAPNNRPGYLRVNSVHQGAKALSHQPGFYSGVAGGARLAYDDGVRAWILAFACGTLLLQFQPELPGWGWPFLAGVACLVLAWRLPWSLAARGAVVLAGFCLGFAWAAWRAELRLADELPAVWEGQDVELVGVVAALPQGFAQGSRFEFDVEKVVTPGAAAPGRIVLSWYRGRAGEEIPALRPGERRQLVARLKRPHGNANPQAFDYEAWLLERNLRATGYVRSGAAAPLDEMVWRPAYAVERLRLGVRDSFARLLPAGEYPWGGVLVALAVGDQRAIQGDLWTIFNRTGTTHLMSISGLHVTMVAALAAWLAGWGWRRSDWLMARAPAQRAAIVAGFLAAFFYAALAGFAVPAQRTLYMLGAAALALLSGRLFGVSRILCLGLLAVLLFDPWAGLTAGFWLSFGAVAALLFIAAGLTGETPGWRGRIAAWGAVQWAATLASLPVLLLVFQQFSLVSPLANALAIPVVSFVVTPLTLLGAVFPWRPILALAHGVLGALMAFLQWCAAWPVWQAAAPPLGLAAAGGLGVALLLLPRGVPGRLAGALFLLPLIFWPPPRPPEGTAWITVLDVGQGLAVLAQTREHALIYDPGPLYSAESDAGQRVVVPYLRALGLDRLDVLMVTHRDTDHSGGTASVQAALPVAKVLTSVAEIPGEPCLAGQGWQWNGVVFEILHPLAAAEDRPGKSNHLSCVLRISAGERRMLLTSDIEAPDERELLARSRAGLSADVLLAPHHGSATSSTADFLAAVGASQAVIPVGYRNRFGHPKEEVLERYRARDIALWRTDLQGAIRLSLAPEGVAIRAWRQEHRRYWHGR